MSHQQISEILTLRFRDRDKKFALLLKTIKQDMAARGMLNSGDTIRQGHEALVREFQECRKVISAAVSEYLLTEKPAKVSGALTGDALDWLLKRGLFLEGYYLEQMKPVISGLTNQTMFAPFLDLSNTTELNEQELRLEIAKVIEAYTASQGKNLFERVKNEMLDRPLIVVSVIAFSVSSALLAFFGLFMDSCVGS